MRKTDIILLIPHYNNLDGLSKSLESISDNELIDVLIVDDGSVEKPDKEVLSNTFTRINQITVLYQEKNLGIEYALNAGLQYIVSGNKYIFIARLDCGDLSDPCRFTLQKNFLLKNPDIHLVGTWAMIVDDHYKPLYQYRLPTTPQEIRKTHYYKSAFVHSSIMFRSASLIKTGFYPLKYPFCEDTAFCYQFILNFKTSNIPLPLVTYVIDPNSISQTRYRKQKLSRIHFSLDTFSFRYFFVWSLGLIKNIVCYILGARISLAIAFIIKRKNIF